MMFQLDIGVKTVLVTLSQIRDGDGFRQVRLVIITEGVACIFHLEVNVFHTCRQQPLVILVVQVTPVALKFGSERMLLSAHISGVTAFG